MVFFFFTVWFSNKFFQFFSEPYTVFYWAIIPHPFYPESFNTCILQIYLVLVPFHQTNLDKFHLILLSSVIWLFTILPVLSLAFGDCYNSVFIFNNFVWQPMTTSSCRWKALWCWTTMRNGRAQLGRFCVSWIIAYPIPDFFFRDQRNIICRVVVKSIVSPCFEVQG